MKHGAALYEAELFVVFRVYHIKQKIPTAPSRATHTTAKPSGFRARRFSASFARKSIQYFAMFTVQGVSNTILNTSQTGKRILWLDSGKRGLILLL